MAYAEVKAVLYRVNGMDFMKLKGAEVGKVYDKSFLENLAGFPLRDEAPEMLARSGFIRVCSTDDYSYRIVG